MELATQLQLKELIATFKLNWRSEESVATPSNPGLMLRSALILSLSTKLRCARTFLSRTMIRLSILEVKVFGAMSTKRWKKFKPNSLSKGSPGARLGLEPLSSTPARKNTTDSS